MNSPPPILHLRSSICVFLLLPWLLLPNASQAQFGYATTNGTITITGCTGSGGAVIIPDTIDGLPVTSIGHRAFAGCDSMTNVTLGNSVTNIGHLAFEGCRALTAINVDASNPAYSSLEGVLFNKSQTRLVRCPGGRTGTYATPESVVDIGDWAFYECTGLGNVTLGNSVMNIGSGAFRACIGLTNVIVGSSVTTIGDFAFLGCESLAGVYCSGNAPGVYSNAFNRAYNATVYYLPGTAGWGATIGDRPTAHWSLPYPLILDFGSSFGVQSNVFGFVVSWATNEPVVVEACTDLANPTWSPVSTNTLTDGWSYFSDPQWTNHPSRLYRLRWP